MSTPSAKSALPSSKAKAVPLTCAAADLRATLTGKQRLKPKQATTFQLSLINGSKQACVATVTRENFELKIYSGRDRDRSSTRAAGRGGAARQKHNTDADYMSLSPCRASPAWWPVRGCRSIHRECRHWRRRNVHDVGASTQRGDRSPDGRRVNFHS